jgi:IclR family pca regulon transcriptional regulator
MIVASKIHDKVTGKHRAGLDQRYIVPGLSRGIAMLQLFRPSRTLMSIADLASEVKISRSAAYRLIYTLESEGFVTRDETGQRYRVTAKAGRLGFEFLGSLAIDDIAKPHLRRLSLMTLAASYMAILSNVSSVYVTRVAPVTSLVSNLQIGSHHPAHLTASGRIMLAHVSQERLEKFIDDAHHSGSVQTSSNTLRRQAIHDRKRGYVFHASLVDPSVLSCACVVRNAAGTVEGAVSVVAPAEILSAFGTEEAVARAVDLTARDISRDLGFNEPQPPKAFTT